MKWFFDSEKIKSNVAKAEKQRIYDWDKIWLNIATEMSNKSKDPVTKVGALIVSNDKRQISIGYNGFARKVIEDDKRWERPNKYEYVIHAELNAILNAKFNLDNCTLYSTLFPCNHCASCIIQAGIKRVISLGEYNDKYGHDLSRKMFQETNVEYELWSNIQKM